MSKFSHSVSEFINVAGLAAYIKTLEAELNVMKALHDHLDPRAIKPGPKASSRPRCKKRAKVKETVLAYLAKNRQGKAQEIANLSGLKVTSVNQTLFGLKKAGHVKQDKKRGSPFVLVKK